MWRTCMSRVLPLTLLRRRCCTHYTATTLSAAQCVQRGVALTAARRCCAYATTTAATAATPHRRPRRPRTRRGKSAAGSEHEIDDDDDDSSEAVVAATAPLRRRRPRATRTRAATADVDEDNDDVAAVVASSSSDDCVRRDEHDGDHDDENDRAAHDEVSEALTSRRGRVAKDRRDGRIDGHGDDDDDEDDEEAAAVAGDTTHSKRLADAYPSLAAEYAAAGADNATPVTAVLTDSALIATWKCATCARLWRCGVFVRTTLRNTCPHCRATAHTTLASARPELLRMWDAAVNDPFVSPATLAVDSNVRASWRCQACGQSFVARVRDVVSGKARCTSCALGHAQSVDDMAHVQSALQQEWHPLRNGDLRLAELSPSDYKAKVWWLCSHCGHDWQATLSSRLSRHHRTHGRLCPACRGKGGLTS